MFDLTGAFTKQFTPVDSGYLYHSSPHSGGKFVTPDEFARLSTDWRRIAGWPGLLKTAALTILAVQLWLLIAQAAAFPEWTNVMAFVAVVAAILGRIVWVSSAPYRLVKDREAIAPPLSSAERGRMARDMVTWPVVVGVALFSAGIFAINLSAFENTPIAWAWLIGSGLMCLAYILIGIRKLKDRRR